MFTKEQIQKIANKCANRNALIQSIIGSCKAVNIAEVGVFKGDLSAYLLKKSSAIKKYALVDPWRNLADWNKPFNQSDEAFEEVFQTVLRKLDFAKERIEIHRGKTQEVSSQFKDESLDFIYIDGDHTLKGITIDLIQWWDKLNEHGVLMGDDFYPSIKRKNLKYEPTLVFPFALYFAEAMNVKIYGLPYHQFLIDKSQKSFEFIDFTDSYHQTTLKPLIEDVVQALQASNSIKSRIKRLIKGR